MELRANSRGLVAVVDASIDVRQSIAALLWLELGLDTCCDACLSELVRSLDGRAPILIIAAGDARELYPRPLLNWMRFVPVIGIGTTVWAFGHERHLGIVQRPIDGQHLLRLIPELSAGDGDEGLADLAFQFGLRGRPIGGRR
jgi:hypothetical protein